MLHASASKALIRCGCAYVEQRVHTCYSLCKVIDALRFDVRGRLNLILAFTITRSDASTTKSVLIPSVPDRSFRKHHMWCPVSSLEHTYSTMRVNLMVTIPNCKGTYMLLC